MEEKKKKSIPSSLLDSLNGDENQWRNISKLIFYFQVRIPTFTVKFYELYFMCYEIKYGGKCCRSGSLCPCNAKKWCPCPCPRNGQFIKNDVRSVRARDYRTVRSFKNVTSEHRLCSEVTFLNDCNWMIGWTISIRYVLYYWQII